MNRNDPAINKEVSDKLESLRARAAQQPHTYITLFREALELADEQFYRAMAAEQELAQADEDRCCNGLGPEACAKVPGRHCDGQR